MNDLQLGFHVPTMPLAPHAPGDEIRRVLIADDSRTVVRLLSLLLEREGCRVTAVSSGTAALEVLTGANPPRLAILDWEMPGLAGVDVCRRLRARAGASAYLILLTSNEDRASILEGLRAGADDYLTKPWDDEVLRARINVGWRILGLQERLSENVRSLEESNALLTEMASVVETSGDAIMGVDASGFVTSWNRGAEDVLRHSAADAIGRPLVELIGKATEDAVARIRHVIRTGHGPVRFETPATRRDGAELYLSVSVAPTIGPDGAVVGAAAIARDVTALVRTRRSLRDSEQTLQLALDASHLGTWEVDMRTGAASWSDPTFRIFGVPPETRPWTLEEYLDHIPEDDRARVRALAEHAFATGGSYGTEHGILYPDGSVVWVETKTSAFHDVGGTIERMVGTVADITERRAMELQLRQAQKMESIGQLAAGIAHEINTPVQYVGDNTRFLLDAFRDLTGMLDVYRDSLAALPAGVIPPETAAEIADAANRYDVEFLTEEIPRAVDQALEGTDRITQIVQSMKYFAHPGRSTVDAVDLNKAVEGTTIVARNEWKYVADLETRLDPSLPLVPCVLGDINQVILNLVVNAAHAVGDVVRSAGGKGRITIATRREEAWAVIEVADTGTGIPEAARPRLFEPFFTTKEVGRGTGQGLAISYSIVERHGGTISFTTELGRGTTFTVRLPLEV